MNDSFWKFAVFGAISLTALLFVLKVAQIGLAATWPWWGVFLPIWGPFAVAAAIDVARLPLTAASWIGAWFSKRRYLKSLYSED